MTSRRRVYWNETKKKILGMLLKGCDAVTIARAVGKSKGAIYSIISSKSFTLEREKMKESMIKQVRMRFEEKAINAVDRIVHLVDNGLPEDRIKLDAAKEVLYQIGCKPVEVIETRKREYTPDEIQSSLQTMKEIEKISEKLTQTNSRFIVDGASVEDSPCVSPRPVSTNTDAQEEPISEDVTKPVTVDV